MQNPQKFIQVENILYSTFTYLECDRELIVGYLF